NEGKRSINVDLKNIQETDYPQNVFEKSIEKADTVVLCNINFSRKYLKIAKNMNKLIASDVHAIQDLEDDYNKDYMKYSDILFMSDENIKNPENFIEETYNKFKNKIIVIGLGKKGALIHDAEKKEIKHFKAVDIRPIVNTIGAGDSLFSSFTHFYAKGEDSYEALKKAIFFAGYKIGEKSASEGFLTEDELKRYIYKKCRI
ncbi:MAG: carbohydrate kinase family protein, partial [Thermotogota bacterium]